ncbi:hypothetical protein [Halovenus sp. HT40]|uniref:hypothetical protein n=1 Tax=Halovenus sp. HT40 TaxID=3126691 RepID=UPI00300E7D97
MERPDPAARDRQLLSRLRIGFVALVAVSAGLIASYADGSLLEAASAVGGGAVVGVLLVWLAFPSPSAEASERSPRR